MRKLIDFWNKDSLNKLIVAISILLALAVFAFALLILSMPAGKSIPGAIGEYFPTSTLEPRVLLTRSVERAMTQSAAATASVPPTITTMPFTVLVKSPTPGPSLILEPTLTNLPPTTTATLFVPTATLPPTPTPTLPLPTPTKSIATATLPGSKPSPSVTPRITGSPASLACLPANPPQKGKVVDVLDGNTIKVLIDGFAYVVRYIGIDIPANQNYAKLSALTNGDLVFAEEVTLIPDVTDKDDRGRLLRYIKVGDKYPAIELLQKGLATAVDVPPNSACAKTYQGLEQVARNAKIGIWVPTPTFPSP